MGVNAKPATPEEAQELVEEIKRRLDSSIANAEDADFEMALSDLDDTVAELDTYRRYLEGLSGKERERKGKSNG